MREVKVSEIQKRKRRARRLRRTGGALVAVAILVGVIALLSQRSTPAVPPVNKAIAPVCLPKGKYLASYRHTNFTAAPPMCIAAKAIYDAAVKTDVGTFVISMPAAAAPKAVNNFVFLAGYRFFDGTNFFRVIRGFVVQGGSPTNLDSGGPGYYWMGGTPPKSCAKTRDCYPGWSVAYANSTGPGTNESQFFVVVPGGGAQLSPDYTLFGTLVKGRSVVARIARDGGTGQQGVPVHLHHIISVTITKVAG
ncbi:MAG: peptidylprolyl isomerase [Acidimicrobiales bacterium]|jgi:cyclophilin family peptidyl-prolyl cis-trans isomerase